MRYLIQKRIAECFRVNFVKNTKPCSPSNLKSFYKKNALYSKQKRLLQERIYAKNWSGERKKERFNLFAKDTFCE